MSVRVKLLLGVFVEPIPHQLTAQPVPYRPGQACPAGHSQVPLTVTVTEPSPFTTSDTFVVVAFDVFADTGPPATANTTTPRAVATSNRRAQTPHDRIVLLL
jgi:hypothetical protein